MALRLFFYFFSIISFMANSIHLDDTNLPNDFRAEKPSRFDLCQSYSLKAVELYGHNEKELEFRKVYSLQSEHKCGGHDAITFTPNIKNTDAVFFYSFLSFIGSVKYNIYPDFVELNKDLDINLCNKLFCPKSTKDINSVDYYEDWKSNNAVYVIYFKQGNLNYLMEISSAGYKVTSIQSHQVM